MTDQRPEILFVGSRELREIPKGWQHPRDERGRYIPLLPCGYVADDDEPTPSDAMMPDTQWLIQREIAAYETVSEGTPISPAFPDTEQGPLDLINYCAEHCTTFGDRKAGAEAWAAILFGDAAVRVDGTVIAQG